MSHDVEHDVKHIVEHILDMLKYEPCCVQPTLMDGIITQYGKSPFHLLIACLLSLRARDRMVEKIVPLLFARVRTPQDLCDMSRGEVEALIRPIGFYVRKSEQLTSVSCELIRRFGGRVPGGQGLNQIDDLLSIKGIGRKTANLVLWYAYGIPTIAVDVHVHRISNRLGVVKTKKPEETEQALKHLIHNQRRWPEVNRRFVLLGQSICLPRHPRCGVCPLKSVCKKIGVTRTT